MTSRLPDPADGSLVQPMVPRTAFGSGRVAAARRRSVFINCPYDAEYRPRMDALIFVAVCCGFLPRSAMESGDVSIPRIDRIHSALRGSRYSVHDLARCQGEGPADLARFNMPLELGVAMGLGQAHDWVALVPDQHPYARFVSDLAGFDLRRYDSSEAGLVMAVMPWLATRPDAIKTPTPAQVMDALTEFRSELGELRSAWLGEPPWVDVVQAAIGVAQYRWDEWTLGPSVSVRAAASGRLESA